MSENNLPNEELKNSVEEIKENVEEVVEEVIEEATEKVEEVIESAEESFEDVEEFVEEALDDVQEKVAEILENIEKKKPNKSAIVAWVLVAALVVFDVLYFFTNIYNKYNHMGYYDVTGFTIGETVAGMGMEFEEFKELYGLPDDMRKDTNVNAAQSMVPISKMAELNGMDIETLKITYNFGEEIDETSTWGEAIDSMKLIDYVGEEQFAEFKQMYGFGDEITLDTKWGDIRKKVEKMQIAERLAAKDADDTVEDDVVEDVTPTEEEAISDPPAEEVPAE